MTEKVMITEYQEKALDEFKRELSDHDALEAFIDEDPHYLDFTTEQFALILCGWYEVEPEFKEGDWIIAFHDNGKHKCTGRITGVYSGYLTVDVRNVLGGDLHLSFDSYDVIRHATESEIKGEKIRRKTEMVVKFINHHKGDIEGCDVTYRDGGITGLEFKFKPIYGGLDVNHD